MAPSRSTPTALGPVPGGSIHGVDMSWITPGVPQGLEACRPLGNNLRGVVTRIRGGNIDEIRMPFRHRMPDYTSTTTGSRNRNAIYTDS